MKFSQGTLILKQKTKAEEIIFLLSGTIINEQTERVFSVGAMLGETDIYFKRDRIENYRALTKVYLLKYDKVVFESILENFPEIKYEVEDLANEREKIRII